MISYTPRNKLSHGRKTRWLRVGDLPFSRATVYRMIEEDLLMSVVIRLRGSRRSIRLVDSESLDAYLLSLQKKQRKASHCNKAKAAKVMVKA
jgi:hypothetical protein